MVKAWILKIEQELRTTLTRPGAHLTRGQKFLQLSFDLGRHARRELREHSATTMAAALTYRTIFGLVPMIVMALIVFRAFGGFAGSQEGLTDVVYDLLEIQVEAAELIEGDNAQEPSPEADQAVEQRSWLASWYTDANGLAKSDPEREAELANTRANAEMRQRIDELVGGIAQGATSISIGGIGVVGMLLLIWAALGLIVTVEKTFNTIYDAPLGRGWHLRIPIYWAVITLGPVLIWGSFYLSTQFITATQDVPILGWLVGFIKQFTALLVTWLLFLLLFTLMPNTKVAVKPAMVGALVSALAWELMKAALRWYVESAVISPTQARLYGSLALIPILLFWVYMTWMVILVGLEVSHILQTLPAHRVGRYESTWQPPAARDPWLVIPVMSAVAEAFDTGQAVGLDMIAGKLGAPVVTLGKIADDLVGRGLLHRLTSEAGDRYTLAMPPSKIRIAELIAVSHGDADADRPGYELLMQLAKAQDAALADVTLANRPAD